MQDNLGLGYLHSVPMSSRLAHVAPDSFDIREIESCYYNKPNNFKIEQKSINKLRY
jgi:hypothetical protein